jgi:ABC-2 type transport system permease protein
MPNATRASEVPGIRKKGLSSPFRSLLAMEFKVEYGQRGLAEKIGLGRKSRAAYVYLVLLALAFVPLVVLLYQMGDAIAAQSVAMGQPGLVAIFAVMAGQFIVLIVGVSALMSTLYYAADLETLQALPLTGRQILIAKVLVGYVMQPLFSTVLMVPFIIPLGLRSGDLFFWVSAALVDLTVPAIPLALALLATVLIMRSTRGLKRRDLFRVVFGLVFFVAVIGFEYVNTRLASQGPEAILRAVMERNGLVKVISGCYPPLTWAAWAFTGSTALSRLLGLALFTGVSVAALLTVVAASQGWFLGGVTRDVATTGKAAAETGGRTPYGLFSSQRDPSSAVALRDHRVLTRTPSFMLTALINILVVPVLAFLGTIGGGGLDLLVRGAAGEVVVLILAGVQGVLASMNQVASTAISREGGTFWLSKMIPVPARAQIRGKVRYSYAVAVIQLAELLAVAWLILKLDALRLVVVAVLGLLVSWPVTIICTLNDLYSPKLGWTDPHQAIKGNLATLGAMLFSAVYVLAAGAVLRVVHKAGVLGVPLYAAAAALAAVSGYFLQRLLEDRADARYKSIEV